MSRRAFLGLGSNVGDRKQHLREAIARLAAASGVNFVRQSSVYETDPVGVTEQRRFLNMVIEVEAAEGVTPRDLLELAKQVEAEMGRRPRERWGPREVDVDVLLVGEEMVGEEDLEVPHPRMWERAFVMAPLAELSPDLPGPGGERAADIARRLQGEQVIHARVHL